MTRATCNGCGRVYGYPIERCTYCQEMLSHSELTSATIIGVTEVSVPSIGHEDVPYWCAVVESEDGDRQIVKLDHPRSVGDQVALGSAEAQDLETVGVLGTGVMGKGLVELLLQRGHAVVWAGRSLERLQGARDKVVDRLARVMDEDEIEAALVGLNLTEDYGPLAVCDVVVEAVLEELEPKQAVLAEAEASMRPDALLATNTSGLSIDDLADVLERPERFGVLHFFNPASRMRLVEVSRSRETSDDTMARLGTFAVSLGKRPIEVAARPAFVVNRVLMPLINEAVRSLEEKAAPPAEIDEAIRLGLNHPMGPLALADLIGLDIVVDIMDNLVAETADESYAPRLLLREMVESGRLGRKTREGFYTYT